METLRKAILDGRASEVRSLIRQEPSLLALPTSGRIALLELARGKGVMETIAVLLHAGAPGAEAYDEYEHLLRAYVMETSQSWTAAGWYSGIEFIIWSLVTGDRASFQFSEYHAPFSLGAGERAEWRFLAEQANGWPTYEAFLTLEAWEKLYADNPI